MKRAIVRRAKLYYLRELAGKAARLKESGASGSRVGRSHRDPERDVQQRLGRH